MTTTIAIAKPATLELRTLSQAINLPLSMSLVNMDSIPSALGDAQVLPHDAVRVVKCDLAAEIKRHKQTNEAASVDRGGTVTSQVFSGFPSGSSLSTLINVNRSSKFTTVSK